MYISVHGPTPNIIFSLPSFDTTQRAYLKSDRIHPFLSKQLVILNISVP